VRQLEAASPKIPPFPLMPEKQSRALLPVSTHADGHDVIAESYRPAATIHNAENLGLEPVWPYDLIGDDTPLFDLAKRTYEYRPYKGVADWSFDPVQAARLGLGDEVRSMLLKVTEDSQHSVNGLANWDKEFGEFYVEQVGVVADALQEALVQDYDGLIRLAPATPPGWSFDGSVYVRGKTRVDVQVREGRVTTAVIEAGRTQSIRIRNPWPGEAVDVVASPAMVKIVSGASSQVISFRGIAGTRYLLQRLDDPVADTSFVPVAGVQAVTAKRLGKVQIGLFASTLSGELHGQVTRAAVVTLGASITEGAGSTHGTNRSWLAIDARGQTGREGLEYRGPQ
jgi:alpha-L-fucosidase 2